MDLKRLSLLFAAGAVGGLANVIAIWILGKLGLPLPKASLGFLYKQAVWGGLWGLIFLIPVFAGSWWKKGMLMGLAPALLVLFFFLPQRGAGIFGLNVGPAVPVMVVFLNVVVWGLATAYWAKLTDAIDNT